MEIPNSLQETKKFGKPKKLAEILDQVRSVRQRLLREGFRHEIKYNPEELKYLFQVLSVFLTTVPYTFDGTIDWNEKGQVRLQEGFERLVRENKELFPLYRDLLTDTKKREEEKIKSRLENFKSGLEIDPQKRKYLDKISINLEGDLSPEQAALIRENFKSGNFLLHTTDVERTLGIFKEGAILTATELQNKTKRSWSRGGRDGIHFNLNDVRILTGDQGHLIGLLTSPEGVLGEERVLKVNSDNGAKYEVSLEDKFAQVLPHVPLDKLLVLVSSRDATVIKDILAGLKLMPKAVLIYPQTTLRIESWLDPIGDHEIASELLHGLMKKCNVPEPAIDWTRDMFASEPEIVDDTFVRDLPVPDILN